MIKLSGVALVFHVSVKFLVEVGWALASFINQTKFKPREVLSAERHALNTGFAAFSGAAACSKSYDVILALVFQLL